MCETRSLRFTEALENFMKPISGNGLLRYPNLSTIRSSRKSENFPLTVMKNTKRKKPAAQVTTAVPKYFNCCHYVPNIRELLRIRNKNRLLPSSARGKSHI